ncbi:MAG TPA: prepilin-type N-terminal cleavage/methylation domain-containing protein [Gemmatimonadales bacterium]|jgi:type II secretory pathway pseudopilin PulG
MKHDRRGVGLIEVVLAIAMFAIVIAGLSPVLVARARRERLATAETYRWALSAEAINRINATPAAAMATGTTCDTAAALPIQFRRCITITNLTTRLQRASVVVLPINLPSIPGDTTVLDRANNVGPLDLGGS